MADEEEDPASTNPGLHTGETHLDASLIPNVLKSTSCPNTTAGSSMDPSHELTPEEASFCVVCTDSAADVTFEPCGHKFTCHECSLRMTKCLKCKAVITKKCPTDQARRELPGNDVKEICLLMREKISNVVKAG